MVNKIDYFSFLKSLISFSPRQIENEKKTADFIISFLRRYNIPYKLDYFFTQVPKIEKAVLIADKKKIPCQGCSFVSGMIKDKNYLLSSLIPSRFFIDKSNINFNPDCDEISLSNFYFAPALAVSRKDVTLLLKAKKVIGKVKVKAVKYQAVNILVGNQDNPRVICFAHYDCLGKGAIDNASGVTVLMETIISKPETFRNNLYVFSANEELSYDKPTYWGHGFRVFEKRFFEIMQKAKKIIVVDCVGNGPTRILRDDNLKYLAFPISNLKRWSKKIEIIVGDIQKLMSVYHSESDDLEQIKPKYLSDAFKKFYKEIYAN
jgi:hypothetical protein